MRSADLLDALKENIISAYAPHRNGAQKLSSMMDEETWLTAMMRSEMGFITEITELLQAQLIRKFDITKSTSYPRIS
jgi:ATP-dependent protease ClpP protease subunit